MNLPVLVVVPARLNASRFPGKLLQDLGGISVLQRTWQQCKSMKIPADVLIATDSPEIFEVAKSFGAQVFLSQRTHETGTSRCLECWESLHQKGAQYRSMLNVQGDEPFVPVGLLEDLCLEQFDKSWPILTAVCPIQSKEQLEAPQTVKVVFAEGAQKALYFSRQVIPFTGHDSFKGGLNQLPFWRHLGLYCFSAETCNSGKLNQSSPLSRTESLEQLAWLEQGIPIGVWKTSPIPGGIDTPLDLEMAKAFHLENPSNG